MNIYVGNLDFKVVEDELNELFGAYGTVSSSKIITDKYNGRSKGFGFVTMDDQAEAEAAIKKLHGEMHRDRALTVNEAQPPKQY